MKVEIQDYLDEIVEYYKDNGMSAKMGAGERPAIVVIDFQKSLTNSELPAGSNMDAEIDQTLKLLKVAREYQIPVFYTIVAYENVEEGGHLVKKIPALKAWKVGTELVELDDRIQKMEGEHIITKKFGSSFAGTNLLSLLNYHKCDTVILTGCSTSGCVRATAYDAIQNGFHCLIPRECVADRSRLAHEVNLMDMDARLADVMSISEVIEYVETTK